MAFDSYGAPQFGLNDVKIATWNATDDYEAEVDVPSVQAMNTTLRVVNAELTGDDQITASSARVIGAQITLRFGSVSLAALEVMLGSTPTVTGVTPNAVKEMKIDGGQKMPYFGIVGKALAEEGTGEFLVFIPKAKITGDVTLASLEYGNFAIPEMTVMAVGDDTYGAVNLIERETAADIAIPPIPAVP